MFLLRLKNFIATAGALLLALSFVFFSQVLSVSRFASLDGERSFYLKSTSSQAIVKQKLAPWEVFAIKGESIVFPCEDREETLAALTKKYGAKILFEEDASGSISYYCITSRWSDGIKVNGVFVNLHIAFNGKQCAVGSPLLFGGF